MVTIYYTLDLLENAPRPWTKEHTAKVMLRKETVSQLAKIQAGHKLHLQIMTDYDKWTSGKVSPLTDEMLDEYFSLKPDPMNLTMVKAKFQSTRTTTRCAKSNSPRIARRDYSGRFVKLYHQAGIPCSIQLYDFLDWIRDIDRYGFEDAPLPTSVFRGATPRTLIDALEQALFNAENFFVGAMAVEGLDFLGYRCFGPLFCPTVLCHYEYLTEVMWGEPSHYGSNKPNEYHTNVVHQSGLSGLKDLKDVLQDENLNNALQQVTKILSMLSSDELSLNMENAHAVGVQCERIMSGANHLFEQNGPTIAAFANGAEAVGCTAAYLAPVQKFMHTHGIWIPIAATGIVYCIVNISNDKYGAAFATFGLTLSGVLLTLYPEKVNSFIRSVVDYFSGNVKPQSGGDIIVTFLSGLALAGTSFKSLPASILQKLNGFERSSQSLDKIFDMVTDFFIESYNFVANKTGSVAFIKRSLIKEHIMEANQFIYRMKVANVSSTYEDFAICQSLLARVDEDIVKYAHPSITNVLRDVKVNLVKIMDTLKPIYGQCLYARVEPLFTLLVGAPGVGKSLCSAKIAHAVTKECLSGPDLRDFERDPSPFIHNRVPNKFWEGYSERSFTTRLDDLGQCVEVPGQSDSELFEHIIKAVNTFPYPLNMAFEGKGKTFFKSEFMIATSNLADVVNETIKDRNAIDRRIHKRVAVGPKREYCQDYSKSPWQRTFKDEVKLYDDFVGNIEKYIEFTDMVIHHNGKCTSIGAPYSCDELVHSLVTSLLIRKEKHVERCVQTVDVCHATSYNEVFQKKLQTPIAERDFFDSDDDTSTMFRQAYKKHPVWKNVNYDRFLAETRKFHPKFYLALEKNKDVASFKAYLDSEHVKDLQFQLELPEDVSAVDYNPLVIENENWAFTMYKRLKDFVSKPIVIASVMAASAGLSYLTYKRYKKDAPGLSPVLQSREFSQRGVKATQPNNIDFNVLAQAGSMYDPARVDILDKVLNKNFVSVDFSFGDEEDTVHHLGYGLVVRDDFMIMPNHFLLLSKMHYDDYPDNECYFTLTFGMNSNAPVYVEASEFLFKAKAVEGTDDLTVVKLPRTGLGPRPNVLKYIAGTQDHITNKKNEAVLTKRRATVGVCDIATTFRDIECSPNINDPPLVGTINGKSYIYKSLYKYPVATKQGDCGMLMSIPNTRSSSVKVFGMHVLGDTSGNYGFATKLHREYIEEAIASYESLWGASDIVSTEEVEAIVQCGAVSNVPHIAHVDTLEKPVAAVSKSAMVKSPFFELYQPAISKPAILRQFERNGVVYNPYALGLKKYCINKGYLDNNECTVVSQFVFERLVRVSKPAHFKDILTPEEACEGIPDYDIGPIPKNTSPGYPHVNSTVPGLPYRYRFFGKEPGYDFDNDHFRQLKLTISKVIEDASNGIRTPWYILDNLKDEDLPIEKVNKGKARIFCAVPIEKLILDKMYFGAFVAWMTQNRVDNGTAIGVNVYGSEWSDIAHHLNVFKGTSCGAGDFSGFDGSQRGQIHQAICDRINEWYDDGPINARIRRVLFADVYNSLHVRGNKVFEWVGGMTSGFYMTAHLNSLYNLFAFTRVFAKICKFDPKTMARIDQFIRVVVMGDDNVYSVHPSLSQYFTEEALSKSFGEIGLQYTNELKDQENVHTALRNLEDLEFLKRKFAPEAKDSDIYLAPMRLDALYCSLDYFKKAKSKEDVEMHINWFLEEVSLHGKEVFNEHFDLLRSRAEDFGYVLDHNSFGKYYVRARHLSLHL